MFGILVSCSFRTLVKWQSNVHDLVAHLNFFTLNIIWQESFGEQETAN